MTDAERIKNLEKRISDLESTILALASKMSQFNRLAAYVVYDVDEASGEHRLNNEERSDLISVIKGEAQIGNWKITIGRPPTVEIPK